MHLEAYVRVANGSGEDYEHAQVRLLVGRVHLLDRIAYLARQQYPYGRPGMTKDPRWVETAGMTRDELVRIKSAEAQAAAGDKVKQIVKEGLSEYFLYTIEGTETIPNKWGKRLLSFETDEIPIKALYKYDEERWGDSDDPIPVIRQ